MALYAGIVTPDGNFHKEEGLPPKTGMDEETKSNNRNTDVQKYMLREAHFYNPDQVQQFIDTRSNTSRL